MISRCDFRLSVLRKSFVRVAKRMFPLGRISLKVMFSASGNSALRAQDFELSSERKILPSPNPNALWSRWESMYGPSGAERYQKWSFSPLTDAALEERMSSPPAVAAAAV